MAATSTPPVSEKVVKSKKPYPFWLGKQRDAQSRPTDRNHVSRGLLRMLCGDRHTSPRLDKIPPPGMYQACFPELSEITSRQPP